MSVPGCGVDVTDSAVFLGDIGSGVFQDFGVFSFVILLVVYIFVCLYFYVIICHFRGFCDTFYLQTIKLA